MKKTSQIITLLIIELVLFLPVYGAFGLMIYNTEIRKLTHNSAEIFWQTDENATSVLRYGGDSSNLDKEEKLTTKNTTHLIQLKDLEGDLTYYYEIEAEVNDTTKAQTSGNFRTARAPDMVGPRPENVTLKAVSKDSATISWTTEEDGRSILYYGKTESLGSTITNENYVKTHSISLRGLEPETLYYYVTSSCDRHRNCVNSSEHYFYTVEGGGQLVLEVDFPKYAGMHGLTLEGNTSKYTTLRVYVNDRWVRARTLRNETSFRLAHIDLPKPEDNLVKIVATNQIGRNISKEAKIGVDKIPPELTFEDIPEFSTSRSLTIRGNASEEVTLNVYVSSGESLAKPERPTNLTNGTISQNSVQLRWDRSDSPNFLGYAIYRNNVLITTVRTNYFTDIGLNSGETYSYQVSMYDRACQESDKSQTLTVLTTPGGTNYNITPEEAKLECDRATPTQSLTVDGEFSVSVSLFEGENEITIEAFDKADNKASYKLRTSYEGTRPTITQTNLGELSPTYVPTVLVTGTVNKPSVVQVYLEDDTEPSHEFETKGEENTFSGNVNLRREVSIAGDRDYADVTSGTEFNNQVKLIAVDRAGQNSSPVTHTIKYQLCGGGADWHVNIDYFSPNEVIPRHLIEGIAQAGFTFSLQWQGDGEKPRVNNVRVLPLELSTAERRNYDTSWYNMQGGVRTVPGSNFETNYVLTRFRAPDPEPAGENWTMLQKEQNLSQHRKGECFNIPLTDESYMKSAGCIKTAFMIEIHYNCERWLPSGPDGDLQYRNATCVQKHCVFHDLLIQPRIDPRFIPESFLKSMVEMINSTINVIDSILEPLSTITQVVLGFCVGMWVVYWFRNIIESFQCSGAVGSIIGWVAGRSFDISRDCEGCMPDGDKIICHDVKNKDYSDACETCLNAKLTTAKIWQATKYFCDRVMCPAVPSYEAYTRDAKEDESNCFGVNPRAYPLGPPKEKFYNEQIGYSQNPDEYDCKARIPEVLTPIPPEVKCCAYEYLQEWGSAALLMNPLKESRNVALGSYSNESDFGKVWRSIRDFALCNLEGDPAEVEVTDSRGHVYLLKKETVQLSSDEREAGKKPYKWRAWSTSQEKVITRTEEGRTINESVVTTPLKELTKNITTTCCPTTIDSESSKEDIAKASKMYEECMKGQKVHYQTGESIDQIIIGGVVRSTGTIRRSERAYVPPSVISYVCEAYHIKEYIIDPTSGLLASLQSVCLSGIYSYLKHYRQILMLLMQCFQTILLTGDGSSGMCQAFISMYICDIIYHALSCIRTYTGPGYGTSVSSTGGVTGFFQNVFGASNSVQRGIENRYGGSNLYRIMFVEKKLIHSLCVGMFTGDFNIDFEAMISSSIELPIDSTVLIAPSTRRFLTFDPTVGRTSHIYHIGLAFIAGADIENYKVELVCSDTNTCTPNNFEGGVCDCARGGGERTKVITHHFGHGRLSQGQVINEEVFIDVPSSSTASQVRYDKVRVTYKYQTNEGLVEKTKETDLIQVGDAPPAYCSFDIATGFSCGLWSGAKGEACIEDTPYVVVDGERVRGTVYTNENIGIQVKVNLKDARTGGDGTPVTPVYRLVVREFTDGVGGTWPAVQFEEYVDITGSNTYTINLDSSSLETIFSEEIRTREREYDADGGLIGNEQGRVDHTDRTTIDLQPKELTYTLRIFEPGDDLESITEIPALCRGRTQEKTGSFILQHGPVPDNVDREGATEARIVSEEVRCGDATYDFGQTHEIQINTGCIFSVKTNHTEKVQLEGDGIRDINCGKKTDNEFDCNFRINDSVASAYVFPIHKDGKRGTRSRTFSVSTLQ